ncbi:YecA family protein [Bhargavaea ginsengi]|uniref:YecA family protein n=1 Tax=Bhargavaea ginsengi TaxID=426757 RepID=UPI003C738416
MDQQRLTDYIIAAASFYGIIPMEKVGQLFKEHTSIGFHKKEVRKFAEMKSAALEAHGVILYGDTFVHELIDRAGAVELYLERTYRKRYYVPELEEMLRYRDESYIEMNEQARTLAAFLREEMQYDEVKTESVLIDVKMAADEPGANLFMNLLLNLDLTHFEERPEEDLGKFIYLAQGMFNHSRSWIHRGRTPLEADEPLVLPDASIRFTEAKTRELIRYIQALVHLYGVVPASKIAEIYNAQNNSDVQAIELLALTRSLIPAVWLIHNRISLRNQSFTAQAITGREDLEKLQTETAGKPYFIPEKRELLRYAKDDYFEETLQSEALRKYTERHFFRGRPKDLSVWMGHAQKLCLHGYPPAQAFSSLLEFGGIVPASERQTRELIELFFDMVNHSRTWDNRGHTPVEMRKRQSRMPLAGVQREEMHSTGSIKVGRNDPCPCGSGKKYKKCCGK